MRRWLSGRGALAALVVGGAVAAGGGWRALGVLLAFFVSSSALTRGGGRRGALQVAANGGVAAVAALAARLAPGAWLAFAGALAAAAADTWSTEIGRHSPTAPRLVTTGRRVSPGTSGGVTWLGSAGGVAGAVFVAAAAALLGALRGAAGGAGWVGGGAALWPVAVGGVAGAWADSLLGATLQARYHCAACGADGESPLHECPAGRRGRRVAGLAWMTNDTVNLAATVVGALVAILPAVFGVPVLPSA